MSTERRATNCDQREAVRQKQSVEEQRRKKSRQQHTKEEKKSKIRDRDEEIVQGKVGGGKIRQSKGG